jgi:molybdopterin synthase sulfur carrier subunit
MIKVFYFAQVAEVIGTRQEQWPLEGPVSGAQWMQSLLQRYPDLAPGKRLKLAINQEHATLDAIIKPGDEVAVFEPVTGG